MDTICLSGPVDLLPDYNQIKGGMSWLWFIYVQQRGIGIVWTFSFLFY